MYAVHAIHTSRLLILEVGLPLQVRDDLMGAQTAGHKPRGRKQNSFIDDAFHHALLEIWIKLVTSFWMRNSAAMVPQSAPPGLHPLVRACMMTFSFLWKSLARLT